MRAKKQSKVWVIIPIVILGGFVYAYLITEVEPPSHPAYKKRVPTPQWKLKKRVIAKLTANALYQEYNDNAINADIKYKGKNVEVSGRIKRIGTDILNDPYVVLGGTGILDGVQCMFPKDQAAQLAELRKQQFIVVAGEVRGIVIGNVLLKKCRLVMY